MGSNYTDKVVISVGGSLIYPNGGIDTRFLTNLNRFVREQLAENKSRQFFLITGGGKIARHYRDAGAEVIGHAITRDDLDWLGIHATKMNAHLVRTIFRDIAHPFVVKHYEIIRKVEEPVVVASGWKPGWSTDYCSVMICEDYGIKTLVNLSNVDQVFDKDPTNNPDAKPLSKVSWEDFRKMVGDEWIPGMNSPFDPVAAKKAHELGVKVVVMDGNNFENLEKYFRGKEFVGTVIE
ncbi:MAG: UMP kinase [Candidatus Levybacteria bacterium]|nr:UMP kinase [Candidatus Levybacteria bacterium]